MKKAEWFINKLCYHKEITHATKLLRTDKTMINNYYHNERTVLLEFIHSVSSLTEFSSHIPSSSFAIAVSILKALIYTYSSPCPIHSCYWLVKCSPTLMDAFSNQRKIIILVCIVRNIFFLWLGKTWKFGIPNHILWDSGPDLFKTQNTRMSQETRDKWDC